MSGYNCIHAAVAELADAHGSGPCPRKRVGVQLPPAALCDCGLGIADWGLRVKRRWLLESAIRNPQSEIFLFLRRPFFLLWRFRLHGPSGRTFFSSLVMIMAIR